VYRLATAAAEFRRNGINGTGLSDLMAAAGLTHGGFYRHFGSKDQLVAEACSAAMESVAETMEATAAHRPAKKIGCRRSQSATSRWIIERIDRMVARLPGWGASLREVMTARAPQRLPGFSSSWMPLRENAAGQQNQASQKHAPWWRYRQ
jgi:AcrR family transcriptional regulator